MFDQIKYNDSDVRISLIQEKITRKNKREIVLKNVATRFLFLFWLGFFAFFLKDGSTEGRIKVWAREMGQWVRCSLGTHVKASCDGTHL